MAQNFDPMTGLPIQPEAPAAPAAPAAPEANPFMAPEAPTAPAAPAAPEANPFMAPEAPAAPAAPAAPEANPFMAPEAPTAPAAPAAPEANPFMAPEAPAAPAAPAAPEANPFMAPEAPTAQAAPAAPATPVPQAKPDVPAMPTAPAAWANGESFQPKKKGKGGLIALIVAIVVVILAAGAAYYFLYLNNPQRLFASSLRKTFSECGYLAEDLKTFKPEKPISAMDIHVDGEENAIDMSFAKNTDVLQALITSQQGKDTLTIDMELNDSELCLNIDGADDRTIVYNYSEHGEGFLAEVLSQQGIDQKTIDEGLKEFYKLATSETKSTEFDGDAFEKNIRERLKDVEFEKVDSKKIEVDGKERKCKGFKFTLTSEDSADLVTIYLDALGQPQDESMKAFLDTLEEQEDTTLRFYVYKGQLACLEADNGKKDDSGIYFHGGDYRLQNIELYSGRKAVFTIKGERDGDQDIVRVIEGDDEDDEIFAFTYTKETGDMVVTVDGEEYPLHLEINEDSLEITANDLEMEGQKSNASLRIHTDPEIREFKKTNPFDIAGATMSELMEYAGVSTNNTYGMYGM